MDNKVQGVVLQSVRYGDTSLVVRSFTRELGLQSYIIKGAFGRTSKNRAAFFQPLSVIDFVASNKPHQGTLGHVKDVQMALLFQDIPSDMRKSAILMYLAELLSKSLTEQERHAELYDFIVQSLQWLDLADSDFANFPVFFTLELSRFLGFYPKTDVTMGGVFDMMEGSFVTHIPVHPYYLEGETASLLSSMLNRNIEKAMALPLRVKQRRALLEGVLTFMQIHMPFVKTMQSQEILKTILE